MKTEERIQGFARLGRFLTQFSEGAAKYESEDLNEFFYDDFNELISKANIYNPWFTEENVRNAISSIGGMLKESELRTWVSDYPVNENKKPLNIAVIMAGNIPLVGFHDMLSVLMSGNRFTGKLSSEDKHLMPFIGKVLIKAEPGFANLIGFTEDKLKDIDAVIATGSNNSARYFEYYFGKYPHIIRKNRNSVAVLTGKESIQQLRMLGEDIFRYFGLGCRNVSKLFVPRGYNFNDFYSAIVDHGNVVQNNKYMNNYEYNRTVYLMSSDPSLLDNNFLLLKADTGFSSPVGVLYYEHYDDIKELNKTLEEKRDQIQCVVSASSEIKNALSPGTAQCPGLTDYADGVDTMKFLTNL
ncbi:MAG: acyl-CoA reductase [Bacteroidota bacterium]|jgi:hypothetical protein|nr:acyl-CoA reductase [Bacteroidota bacterium]